MFAAPREDAIHRDRESRVIKSLLLGIDDTPASFAAQGVALDLAKRLSVTVTGISVLDAARIAPTEAVPIGALHYKRQADYARLQRASEHQDLARRRLLSEAEAVGASATCELTVGDAFEAIVQNAMTRDLVVLGRDVAFDGFPSAALSHLVDRLLHGNPRPLLLCPEGACRIGTTLVAFDGSVAAARSMQLFALLGLGRLGPVRVASIAAEKAAAEQVGSAAVAYLRQHAVEAEAWPLATRADPAEVLAEAAAECGAQLMVMGAYGHRGWRETLLGSCTTKLADRCPVSLFIHH